jgi:Transposase
MRENPLGGKLVMPINRYMPEQIVPMLRQIEISITNGKPSPQACKEAEITVQTFYRWRKEYGGLKMDQATTEGTGEGERQAETAGGGAGAGHNAISRCGHGRR